MQRHDVAKVCLLERRGKLGTLLEIEIAGKAKQDRRRAQDIGMRVLKTLVGVAASAARRTALIASS